MIESIIDGNRITSDENNVWVVDSIGLCMGRYSSISIEIFSSESGANLLSCFSLSGKNSKVLWAMFVDSMKKHHDIEIPKKHEI